MRYEITTSYLKTKLICVLSFSCLECIDGLDSLEKLIGNREVIKKNTVVISLNLMDSPEQAKYVIIIISIM